MNMLSYTIGIPVYERISGFTEALESALSVKGCSEIIVCDDHSSHTEFESIVRNYKDQRIRYIKNESNIGLFGNWNRCVKLSSTDFISILCSDDLIHPDAFNLFLAEGKTDETDVFFGSFTIFHKSVTDAKVIRRFEKGCLKSEDLLRDAVVNGMCFPVLSIIRKSVLTKYPFTEKPHSGNDWLWIYSNAMSLRLCASDTTINYWRRHDNQDAVKSQSVTTDCWPMTYLLMQKQLEPVDRRLARKAGRRAVGVVLTWLLNDYHNKQGYYPRLRNNEAQENRFLKEAISIINSNVLLYRLLYSRKYSRLYYNIGRLLRKTGFYPDS